MVEIFHRTTGGGMTITVDGRAVERMLKKAPDRVRDEMTFAFRRIGAKWERSVKQNFTGYTGQSQASRLQTRTGALRNSVHFRVPKVAKVKDLALRMLAGGNQAPYAKVQEYGKVITAKKPGGMLTIPMPSALTASGALKGSALIRGGGGDYETDMGPTFIYKSDGGGLFVAVAGKTEDEPLLLYILKHEVTIPGPRTTGEPSRLGGERFASLDGPNGEFIANELRVGLSLAFGGKA